MCAFYVDIDYASAELVTSWDGDYGTTYLYRFLTPYGAVLIWRASSSCGDAISHPGRITGTVKAHDDYHGVAQTVITRCRIA